MTAPHQNLLGTSGVVDTEETDPNFNQTVLLLHGDGTNGGQNNTFIDSSPANRALTRNGNPFQGTFNPFLGEGQYSNLFHETETLSTTLSSAIGTGDMTIEFWYFPNEFNDFQTLVSVNATGARTNGFNLGTENTQKGRLKFVNGNGSSGNFFSSNNILKIGVWSHIALTREGSTVRLFHNGTQLGSVSNSTNWSGTIVGIGGRADDLAEERTKGFIMNLNLVVGTAKYDASGYTIPSSLISAHGNTKLLTCQSNRFVDNSASPLTLTVAGTPKVVPFSPLAPTASYSESVHGGSGFFDGSGDTITPTSTSTDFDIDSGEYTFEAWIYTEATDQQTIIITHGDHDFNIYINSGALYLFALKTDETGSDNIINGVGTIHRFNWHHLVVQRDSGGYLSAYVDGTRVYYATQTTHGTNNTFTVGQHDNGTNDYTGYISSLRFIKGSAIYSGATITLPSAPHTSTGSETKLLLNFTNAEIIDNTMRCNLETEDNVQIDTSVKKFGTGSIEFDGTDDRIVIPHHEYHQLGTGQFTVELFVYLTASDTQQGFFGNDAGWYFQVYDGELEFALSTGAIIERTFVHSLNQWYHLAATRDSSNNVRLFIDGTQQGAVESSTHNLRHNSHKFHIGNIGPTTARPFKGGFMDEIRIIKGVAKYISNFTAPTKAFANR